LYEDKGLISKLGAGGTLVILATWVIEIGRIMVLGQPRQKKFARPHLNEKKLGMTVCTCHSSHGKPKIRGLWSSQAWAKSETLSPKYYQSKKGKQ
jgi:hypothetical protein